VSGLLLLSHDDMLVLCWCTVDCNIHNLYHYFVILLFQGVEIHKWYVYKLNIIEVILFINLVLSLIKFHYNLIFGNKKKKPHIY